VNLALVFLVAAAAPSQTPAPKDRAISPLSAEQIAQVRELVRSTQSQAAILQTRLDERQRQLARVYAEYEFDDRKAQDLQKEVVDLQRQLLANHHRMQVELRSIVPKQRFEMLRRRLEQIVSPGVSAGARERSPTKPAPSQTP
jgi:G3E family GTPase